MSNSPKCVAQTSEMGKVLLLPDGTLRSIFLRETQPGRMNRAAMRVSRDHGRTWSDPVDFMELDDSDSNWAYGESVLDDRGEIHFFMLNDRGTGPLGRVIGEGDKNRSQVYGMKIDIWHTCTSDHGTKWGVPHRIWEGYTGALNSAIRTTSGRIVLPFSYITGRNWFKRAPGLDNFTYHGAFSSTTIYSDDRGKTWLTSTPELMVPVPEPTDAYGAVEPVAIQMKDGRLWMAIRTQLGRLYESWSRDGAAWSRPAPTPIISSDSPVGLVRVTDGRLVMFWNCCLRYPYAYGGRQVLHAAVSSDEGATWRGFREVARDPKRHEPPPNQSGDFGTAYPYPTATANNRIVYVTGQGKGRILTMLLDPDWLEERTAQDDFSHGLDEWSVFGTAGAGVFDHPSKPGHKALRVTRPSLDASSAAVWNFPNGFKGSLKLRFMMEPNARAIRVSLTDHFSTPFDSEDAFHALFNVTFGDGGTLPNSGRIAPGIWHTLELRWETDNRRMCEVRLNGQPTLTPPLRKETLGACYLRIVSVATEPDLAGWWFDRVDVAVESVPRFN